MEILHARPTGARIGGDLPTLDDPDLRAVADRVVHVLKLATEKALAHEAEPSRYPLPSDASAAENVVLRYIRDKDPVQLQAAMAQAVQRINTPSFDALRPRGAAAVDLTSATPVEEQFDQTAPPLHADALAARLSQSIAHANGDARDQEPDAAPPPPASEGPSDADPSDADPPGDDAVARGVSAIDSKWNQLGGASGLLGNPTSPERTAPDRIGRFRHYQRGSIYWSPRTGAHEVHGAIRAKWSQLGWERSLLGYPTTDETTTPDGVGRFTHFEGGSVYWTPQTGAHEVHGAIRAKWSRLGWERGYLGYPMTDETTTPDTVGRFTHFQGGSIYWTPRTGAWAVHKSVRDGWERQRWELGPLGYPLSDTSNVGSSSMSNLFQGGRVDWTRSGGAKVARTMTKLEFRLHSVKCVDETDPEWGGDKIDLGGVATDTELGSTLLRRFRVHSDFDDGEVQRYNPPRVVHTFGLLDKPWWPKSFLVTMMLAEIDSGGFNDTLRELLLKIRELLEKELVKLVAAAAGAAAGAAIGAVFGSVLPVVGTAIGIVIGAVVGYVVGAFFDWLIGLFDDDAFLPISVPVHIPSVHHRWSGATDSQDWFYWVKGHGGHYELRGDWALRP